MPFKRLTESLRAALRHDPIRKTVFTAAWAIRNAGHQAATVLRPEPARPRIAVVSMWDENQAPLAAITTPNKAAYCRRHHYTWLGHASGFATDRPIAWSKLLFIRAALADHDWVFWSDADSMVMNPSVSLESIISTPADLIITADHIGINSGSFLLRRCAWSSHFLDTLWTHPETPEFQNEYGLWTDRLWENRAFWHLLAKRVHRRHMLLLPQRKLNSYPTGLYPIKHDASYQPGDFILHLPGLSNARRIQILRAAATRSTDHSRAI